MDGSSPDVSASRGRRVPLWCCGWALSRERQRAMLWEVLIWSVVSFFFPLLELDLNKHGAQCQVPAKLSTKYKLSHIYLCSVCSAFKGQYGLS